MLHSVQRDRRVREDSVLPVLQNRHTSCSRRRRTAPRCVVVSLYDNAMLLLTQLIQCVHLSYNRGFTPGRTRCTWCRESRHISGGIVASARASTGWVVFPTSNHPQRTHGGDNATAIELSRDYSDNVGQSASSKGEWCQGRQRCYVSAASSSTSGSR